MDINFSVGDSGILVWFSNEENQEEVFDAKVIAVYDGTDSKKIAVLADAQESFQMIFGDMNADSGSGPSWQFIRG